MINFLAKFKIPVIVVFFACQFLWYRSGANFLDWQSFTFLSTMSFVFLTGFWLFLLFDMINTKIFNKTFWLISMLIMPWIAPALYLFQRKKLQHIRTSIFRKD
ncbi:hypothetical protein [Salinimicrobium sp. TH3]|uniref:hypothetical protein n=1 Tax=Salinimicrobium sp. TH3 TaxID=2997342 RepID=UPI00227BABA0|nr:hypothetical protein [Salinimicrobium sp. TH3]